MVKTKEVPPMFVDRVIARIKECSRGASKSSGSNMETWESEIIGIGNSPGAEVELDGKLYDLSGHSIRHYLMLEGDNLEQTEKAFARLELGPVLPDSTDCKAREGFCFEMLLKSKENKAQKPVKNPTTGKIEYQVIKDRNGKEISTGWEFPPQNIKELLCKAEKQEAKAADSNKPY